MADRPAPFDLDDPELNKEIDEGAFQSGNYPYEKKLDTKKIRKDVVGPTD